MPKSKEEFERDHAVFQKRLRAINRGPTGQAAKKAMNDLRQAYYDAAIEHWKELGPRASTGWSQPPEADYQTAVSVEQCAGSVRDVLAQHFAYDPNNPPGKARSKTPAARKLETKN